MNTAGNGRDQNGRFAPGNPGGPGRPRRIDVISAAKKFAAENKIDLEEAIGAATIALLEAAKAGDVAAYRAVADRLCGPVKLEMEVEDRSPETPRLPESPAVLRAYFEKMADIAANLPGGSDAE